MDAISQEILEQYTVIDNLGTIDMADMKSVRSYAMKNNLICLAGWLSWNGEKYYQYLVKAHIEGVPLNSIEEKRAIPSVRERVVCSKKELEPILRAPKHYYVDKQGDGNEQI